MPFRVLQGPQVGSPVESLAARSHRPRRQPRTAAVRVGEDETNPLGWASPGGGLACPQALGPSLKVSHLATSPLPAAFDRVARRQVGYNEAK